MNDQQQQESSINTSPSQAHHHVGGTGGGGGGAGGTFLSRIGKWFRKDMPTNGDTLIGEPPHHHGSAIERTTFLRPWAKRDAAIQRLEEGFTTLTDLMGSIRDNLEKQNQRQDELLGALQQLPQVLQSIPESNRMQGETLTAIRQQIEGQTNQQVKLHEILTHIGKTTGEQRQMVDALRDRVEEIHKTDTTIADYLNNVGQSMKDVSSNSKTTSEVLGQMRDNWDTRDGQIERVLHRQGVRFTTMLAVAIFLSIAALVAVGVIGWMLLNQRQGVTL
jgi:small-conductance mechanosensitive channel